MKQKRLHTRRVKAFSLENLMFAMLIMGILYTASRPKLDALLNKARSNEAKDYLSYIYTLQKGYFYEYSQYSEDLTAIGFEPGKFKTEGGNASYRFEVADAGETTFIVRATAVMDFDKDGQLNIWEIDQDQKLKEIVPE